MPQDVPEAWDYTRSSVLYLIDGSESMASTGALLNALKAACKSIRDAAKAGSNAYDAAVIVYNVDGPHQIKNTKTLLDLQEPTIDDLKALIRMANDEDYRKAQLIPLSDSQGDRLIAAFHIANSVLNRLNTKSLRRVIIITNNDDPFQGDTKMVKVAQNLAIDITNSPAIINPIFINPSKSEAFNLGKFWGTMKYYPDFFGYKYGQNDPMSRIILEPVDVEQLGSPREALIMSRSRGKFVAFRGQLRIHKLHIGVKGYNVVQSKARIPTGKYIAVVSDKTGSSVEKRELVSSEPTVAIAASGTEVDMNKADTQRAFRLSGSAKENEWSVPVSDEDFSELYKMEDIPFTVLNVEGFLSIDSIEYPGFVGHSAYIVPSNDISENSFQAFASLHRSMVRKNRAAIVTIHYPQASKIPPAQGVAYASPPNRVPPSEAKNPLQPNTSSGMFFVPLPFQDDIRRDLAKGSSDDASVNEHICSRLQEMLRKFKMPSGFDPRRFPHPRTAQFSEILEHHALSLPLETHKLKTGVETAVEQPDPTKPRYARIASGAGKLALEVKRTCMDLENEDTKMVANEMKKKRKKIP